VVLARDDVEIASWSLPVTDRVDLAVVDALARLQVEARRAGCEISVRGACGILTGLIRLAGLMDVLVDESVEVGGKAEHLEEPGVEEVVVPGDATV
jgi:hypothetical protein